MEAETKLGYKLQTRSSNSDIKTGLGATGPMFFVFAFAFFNDSSLKLAIRQHADSNHGPSLLRCCAPDRSLNTCVVCLFQPLLV